MSDQFDYVLLIYKTEKNMQIIPEIRSLPKTYKDNNLWQLLFVKHTLDELFLQKKLSRNSML